jgi:hypothetical protein
VTAPAREPVRLADVLRFLVELIAWIAAPWALARYSWLLSALSLVVLIGVPAVFATPGDKQHPLVPVPGLVTIGMVLMEVGAAVLAAWAVWPVWAAALTSVLAVACLIAEQPRWRRLLAPRAA